MSVIQDTLEHYREEAVREAEVALASLRADADKVVNEAVDKLEVVVAQWRAATERLGDLGMSSVAEITLNGGAVYAAKIRLAGKRGSNESVRQLLGEWFGTYARQSYRNAPFITLPKYEPPNGFDYEFEGSGGYPYEMFVLLIPNKEQQTKDQAGQH